MDPVEVAVWTSLTCLVLMGIWSAMTEGLEPFSKIFVLPTFLAVLYTCVGASILNIAALFVLRELGPVTQQVVGQLKGILAILGAVAAFGEVITMQQIVGYSLLIQALLGTTRRTWTSRTRRRRTSSSKSTKQARFKRFKRQKQLENQADKTVMTQKV